MLPTRSRWLFAANRLPDGEARLLMFAGEPQNEEGGGPLLPVEGANTEQARQPAPEQPVARAEQQTRARVAGTLEGGRQEGTGGHAKTERQLHAEKALEKANRLHEKMETLQEILQHQSAEAKAKLRGPALQTWLQTESFIVEQAEKAKLMRQSAWEISEWEHGNRSPSQLLDYVQQVTAPGEEGTFAERKHDKNYRREQKAREEARRGIRHAISSAMAQSAATNYNFSDSGDPWETRNQASKIMAIGMVNSVPLQGNHETANVGDYIARILNDIDDRSNAMDGALQMPIWKDKDGKVETMEEFVKRISTGLRELKDGGNEGTTSGGMGSLIPGIRFYSLYEVMEGITKVKDAYVQAYKERSSLRTDILAQQIGAVASYLPWGGSDVPHTLESRLDEANDKVKSHHAEHLKSRNAKYLELFGAHGELVHNSHDGNRARGVLEYAASRGWLYDIDLNSQDRDGILEVHTLGGKFSLRQLVPSSWSTDKIKDYQSTLLTQQNRGKNDETEKYHNRYHNVNKADDFVKLINEEMSNVNLWAVRGIAKRAFERGLKSHISPWVITTIFQHLEENPLIRRVATTDWLDQMGGAGLNAYYTSHFTSGYMKFERDKIREWLESGDPHKVSEAGIFGRALTDIHDDIRKRTGIDWAHLKGKEKQQLNEQVSQILAGKIVEINGQSFSIFSEKYDWYRSNEMIATLDTLNPSVDQEDPDYYTDYCENLIGSTRVVEQILSASGNGKFKYEDKAALYMTNVWKLYNELEGKSLHREAEKFREEISAKINAAIETALGDGRSGGMERNMMRGEFGQHRALAKLTREGFVDLETLINGIFEKSNGSKLAEGILTDQKEAIFQDDLFSSLEKARDENAKPDAASKMRARQERDRIVQEWRQRLSTANGRPPIITKRASARAPAGTGRAAEEAAETLGADTH